MLLFVYGTLRPCFGHPLGVALATRSRALGRATVCGELFDQGDYPVAIRSKDLSRSIHGELFELPAEDQLWGRLDEYEDYKPGDLEHSLFERSETVATLIDGGSVSVHI